ncbi:hypothetical protein [Bacillus cereus]|uniref:hypothetical protein n=1 Tax=Bacillus cereus TaxID=1396 RepID=UPI003D17F4E7
MVDAKEVNVLSILNRSGIIIGNANSGKSSIVMGVIEQSLHSWLERPELKEGFSLFEQNTDLVWNVLNQLMKAELDGKKVEWNKVRIIRFKDSKHVPKLNLLHCDEHEKLGEIVNDVAVYMREIGLFKGGTGLDGERFVRVAIRTLLADKHREYCVLDINRFIADKYFREEILDRVEESARNHCKCYLEPFENTDKQILRLKRLSGVHKRIEGSLGQKYQSLLKKKEILESQTLEAQMWSLVKAIDCYFGKGYLKEIYGKGEFSLEIQKWMDEGYIVLYDFSGMSDFEIRMTSNYIIQQYFSGLTNRPIYCRKHKMFLNRIDVMYSTGMLRALTTGRQFGLAVWAVFNELTNSFHMKMVEILDEINGNVLVCKSDGETKRFLEDIAFRDLKGENIIQNLSHGRAIFQTYMYPYDDQREIGNIGKVSYQIKDYGFKKRYVLWGKPINRYLSNGKMVERQNEGEISKSNEWVLAKMEELEGQVEWALS